MKTTTTTVAVLLSMAASAQIAADIGLSSHNLSPTVSVSYEKQIQPSILLKGSARAVIATSALIIPSIGAGWTTETKRGSFTLLATGLYCAAIKESEQHSEEQTVMQPWNIGAEARIEVNQGTVAAGYHGNGLFTLTVGFLFRRKN